MILLYFSSLSKSVHASRSLVLKLLDFISKYQVRRDDVTGGTAPQNVDISAKWSIRHYFKVETVEILKETLPVALWPIPLII